MPQLGQAVTIGASDFDPGHHDCLYGERGQLGAAMAYQGQSIELLKSSSNQSLLIEVDQLEGHREDRESTDYDQSSLEVLL